MFGLDVETLDLESTAVILSIGAVFYDGEKKLTYNGLFDDGCFIKLDIRDQLKNYGRTKSQDTIDWWKKQSPEAKAASLIPSPDDLSVLDALHTLDAWIKSKPDYRNDLVWARGGLDQLCLDSLARAAGHKPAMYYGSWRDVRTAVEFFYPKSKNGYVEVDTSIVEDFDESLVLKHHPVHDAAFDICMLAGGKS
jgi:hypothetical protein